MADTLLLDTCALRHAFARRKDVLSLVGEAPWTISDVTAWEVRRGYLKAAYVGDQDLAQADRKATMVLSMCRPVAQLHSLNNAAWRFAGDLWARAAARRPAVVIGPEDLLIYSIAKTHSRRLVTTDRRLVELLTRLDEQDFILVPAKS